MNYYIERENQAYVVYDEKWNEISREDTLHEAEELIEELKKEER